MVIKKKGTPIASGVSKVGGGGEGGIKIVPPHGQILEGNDESVVEDTSTIPSMPPKLSTKRKSIFGEEPAPKKARINAHASGSGSAVTPAIIPAAITDQALRQRAESLFAVEDPWGPIWNDDAYCVFPKEGGRFKRQLRESPQLLQAELEARKLKLPAEGVENISVHRQGKMADTILKHEDQRRKNIAQAREAQRIVDHPDSSRLVEGDMGLYYEPVPATTAGTSGGISTSIPPGFSSDKPVEPLAPIIANKGTASKQKSPVKRK